MRIIAVSAVNKIRFLLECSYWKIKGLWFKPRSLSKNNVPYYYCIWKVCFCTTKTIYFKCLGQKGLQLSATTAFEFGMLYDKEFG